MCFRLIFLRIMLQFNLTAHNLPHKKTTPLTVLEMKFRLRLFEPPYINTNNTEDIGSQVNLALALKAARQSIVLLKNDPGILPLDRKKYRIIVVIGPNADECNLVGYSQIPRKTISPVQALKEKYKDVELVYAEGCGLPPKGDRRAKAILAPHAENLKLIRQAVDIAKNAVPVVKMLGGNNNPSEELSISIPWSAGHLSDYYYAKPSARINSYNMDSITALYPFCYGLSYTTYQYSNLRIDTTAIHTKETMEVSVNVMNTWRVDGEEIVQLYIKEEVNSVTRPIKELKNFERIALNPGETKIVNFTITPDKLKFYDLNMNEVIEPGIFDIMEGASSRNYNMIQLFEI